ncbi:MAG: DNA polymerase III subunit alpha [bacterium]|nr:DNA polymerase III subunit alpha [bacterium]
MPQDTFVHLHNHSDYSLLDGAMKTKAMAQRAAEFGMPALALTDHGNMFGAVEFYLNCKKSGIKPIIGTEAYVCDNHLDHTTVDKSKRNRHMVLLAKNETGWRNLLRLSSKGYLDGFYYKPRIDKELLAKHSEGIIGLSACLSGGPSRMLLDDDVAGAIRVASEYAEILGKDNYFLEIQDHGIDAETKVRQMMPEVAAATGLGIVCTNDCHYLDKLHSQAHDLLLCIGTNQLYDDPNRWRYDTDQIYLKSSQEMLELFKDWPDACANTLRIAEMCDLDIKLGELLLPEFPLPEGFSTPDDYLRHLGSEGLKNRYDRADDELTERFEYELKIIKRMGYAGYFLIVWDFIKVSRERSIPVGPGRGSAAGSLICYCLGITDIDPMSNKLIFERFLNPDRISMPDIDIDFCFEKRGEIIQYVVEKYGKENVSQIITFGSMAARGVIKDVGRVLGFPYADAEKVSRMIPEGPGVTLLKTLNEVPGFADVAKESPKHDMLIKNALVLEGVSRNPGIHAAGVLITPSPLVEHIPLYKTNKGDITSQFDMRIVEDMGLLKMDFLGLRTLTVIDKALKLIEKTTGKKISAEEIPMDDSETFKLLQSGKTVGVFQLESSGMQELLRNLKPEAFEDIVAVNALFRPGPLGAGMDKVYVECKHGRQAVKYPHPSLEQILNETNGVILYQEQVMQIASLMGGFTMAEADALRKAMGKKNKEMMDQARVKFIVGAQEREYSKAIADKVFDEMAFFAEYGFNKSHSASYAVLSMQTAWLKAHYPAHFMASTITTEMKKGDRVTQLIDEVKSLGLTIAPPSINKPSVEFGVDGQTIIFGMGAVKNVGVKAITEIVRARHELDRDFTDIFDLCENCDLSCLNKKVLESLISAGAMDSLDGHRNQLLENVEKAVAFGMNSARDKLQGQASLFGGTAEAEIRPTMSVAEPHDPLLQLSLERKSLGFFLSGHPFHEYREFVDNMPVKSVEQARHMSEQSWVELVGVITSYSEARDKNKRVYARCHFEDRTGIVDLTVYSSLYETTAELVASDSILLIGGRVREKSDGVREIIADRVMHIDQAMSQLTASINMEIDLDSATDETLKILTELLEVSPVLNEDGDSPVQVPLYIETIREGKRWVIKSGHYSVALDLEMLRKLRTVASGDGVLLKSGLQAPPPQRARYNNRRGN